MLRPLIERPRRSRAYRSRERGVTMALVALAIFSIIAMAGLAVDLGTLYEASTEAQRAADAGALAAARMISLSGVTGDPTNHLAHWQDVCGGPNSPASSAATAEAQLNTIAGTSNPTVTVTYQIQGGGAGTPNCASQTAAFGVNPLVVVKVQKTSLPTYFSRIWGATGSSVSATATAEVFNPSGSELYSSTGNLIPVQPRCVKPWVVPNSDPGNGNKQFVSLADGTIQNPGISLNGGSASGVIGEQFVLYPDCYQGTGTCNFGAPFTAAPTSILGYLPYLPGLAPASSTAVPSCGNANAYQQAIAGCDQTTAYQCGVSSATAAVPNQLDLNENPSGNSGDTSTAVQCLIHQAGGHDALDTTAYPFQFQAGSGNPLNVAGSTPVTSSNSIVSLPIYDSTGTIPGGQQPSVTIVGFLQVFIQNVEAGATQFDSGTLQVTVLNVAGCGNGVPNGTTPVYGTSPVPVRLITPP
ncbi:MAG: pilus assembly protein TadG-related protein [Candidatus Sulfotelmatobacter sp.]